ncbi:MAG TPA: ABATE domain-containing protein, partial [Gemmatimonadales bacterium]|nr:ABATE domain-containing protein [Gemmatimonadales bacterium]
MPTAPAFGFVANHPGLDLCNTVGEWAGGDPVRDKLGNWADLVAWAVGAGLLSPAEAAALRRPREETRIVARARALRTALHALVLAAIEGRRPSPADLALVERELARARTSERLAAT